MSTALDGLPSFRDPRLAPAAFPFTSVWWDIDRRRARPAGLNAAVRNTREVTGQGEGDSWARGAAGRRHCRPDAGAAPAAQLGQLERQPCLQSLRVDSGRRADGTADQMPRKLPLPRRGRIARRP